MKKDRTGRVMWRLVIFSTLFMSLLVGLLLFFQGSIVQVGNPTDFLDDAPPMERGPDGVYVVPESDIPATFDDRMEASPLALLPTRVPEYRTLPEDLAEDADRAELMQAAEDFLQAWETYTPAWIDKTDGDWEDRIYDFLDPDQQGVSSRDDSLDIDGVCPNDSCLTGSEWIAGSSALRLIDFNGDEAFLAGFGMIRYSPESSSPLAGRVAYRAYGLVLRREDDRWLLRRAAAEGAGRVGD